MVYPFLLMLSSSVASPFDFDDLSIIPKYLKNDDALLKKWFFCALFRSEADTRNNRPPCAVKGNPA